MDSYSDPGDQSVERSLKATYRALLARGLEAGEAANLTAFLHGLPSADFHWTLPEVEAIVRRRIAHAADLRAAAGTVDASSFATSADAPATDPPRIGRGERHPNPHHPSRRTTIHDRRRFRAGGTHVIDPPTP
jgi:predicted phage gp36 major capsid-like protein